MIPFKSIRHIRYQSFLASILITALILAGLGLTTVHPAQADNAIVVNTLSDVSTCPTLISLRCAITTANAAASPTVITFSVSGTITVGSTLTISNSSTNAITIDGTGQTIVIDGGSTGPGTGVQLFIMATGSVVTLNLLTIQHGNTAAGNGGAISNSGTLTINNSTLTNNSAGNAGNINNNGGGAIYNSSSGELTINGSTLSNNSAYNGGGAIFNWGGMLFINNSEIAGNLAIASERGLGGAISSLSPGTAMISNSSFTNNSAYDCGGGIFSGWTLRVDNSTFFNNSSIGTNPLIHGGGVVCGDGTSMIISNSTLSGNSTGYVGGAISLLSSGKLTVSNSTISGNSAVTNGGGLYSSGNLNMISDIVAGNTLTGTGSSGPDVYGPVTSLGHNLIGDGTGSTGLTNGLNGDQVGTSASPIDPKLVALANNGGSTQTMALFANSPAIGTGDCNGNTGATPPAPAVTTDQRGVTRGNPCDAGAYEVGLIATATNTSTPSNTVIATNTSTSTQSATSSPTSTATATASPTATLTSTVTNTATPTSTPIPARIDTIGIYRAGTFYLRLHNSTGNADLTVGFTAGTKPYPVVGDWTGSGFDTVGVYDQSNGQFTLCTTNVTATCGVANQKSLVLGVPNDMPLSGRWLLSATTAGVGVFRPSNGLIYLKNVLTTGYADYTMVLGIPGDRGLAGDWNGKGFDSPGVYRPSNSFFYLSNQVTNGSVIGNYQLQYGLGGDSPVVGDWIAQGHDGVGLFRQSNGFTYLKNQLVTGYADNSFTYGIAGDVPVAGHWQAVYPPIAPASVLIAKTAAPNQPQNSVPDNSPIGD